MPVPFLDTPARGVGGSLSGKLGDQVYARGPNGPYVYTWSPRVDPDTTRQREVRLWLTIAASNWRFLGDAFREAWETYAENVPSISRRGRSYRPTGFNRYIALAVIRREAGGFGTLLAPTVFTLARLGTPTYRPDILGTTVLVRFDLGDAWRHQFTGRVYAYQSKPQPSTVNHWTGPFHAIGQTGGNPLSPPIGATYTLLHPVVAGKPRVWFRIRGIEADNRISPANVLTIDYPGF